MAIRESAKVLATHDVALFMLSIDDIETNTAFAKKNEAPFPILSDPTKQTAEAYGVIGSHGYASRWTFYVDRNGVIAEIDKNVTPLSAGVDITRRIVAMKSAELPASN